MLTGKCKEDFEKWLEKVDFEECNISDEYSFQPSYIGDFERLPFSMQYGVYVDFFDSVGIDVYSCTTPNYKGYYYSVGKNFSWDVVTRKTKTRTEARQKAILKANEIYNTTK